MLVTQEKKSGIWLAIFASAIAILISLCLILPYIRGEYIFVNSEYYLYQSYIRFFIETLFHGEMPLWNEYVGSGHPAIYFGHYPLHYSTLVYSIFGHTDEVYAWMRLLHVSLIFLIYMASTRSWGFSYAHSILGALIYFGVNFVERNLAADTVASVMTLWPAVFFLLTACIRDHFQNRIHLFFYLLSFWFWVSGSPVTYLFMPVTLLCIIFFVICRLYRVDFKRSLISFFVLLILPWLAVAFQFVFVMDTISVSDRLKPGLILPIWKKEPWEQFFRSLGSSAYFWVALITCGFFLGQRYKLKNWSRRNGGCILSAGILILGILISKKYVFWDYVTIALSPTAWIAISFFFFWWWRFQKNTRLSELLIPFIITTAVVSNFFYLPENIQGGGNPGYDYQLYKELGIITQSVLNSLIYLSIFRFNKNTLNRIALLTLIACYILRSHIAILLLRWGGMIWYATRDGLIFSLMFSILAIEGLQVVLSEIEKRNPTPFRVKFIKIALASLLALWLGFTIFDKIYNGESHRMLVPIKFKSQITSERDEAMFQNHKEIMKMREKIKAVTASETNFFRLFSPGLSANYVAGAFQDLHIHEAAHYDSSTSSQMIHFYRRVVLGLSEEDSHLGSLMPYTQFPAHFHRGIRLRHNEMPYVGYYVFQSGQGPKLLNQNIEFWFDIAQVNYLIVDSEFRTYFDQFSTAQNYQVLDSFMDYKFIRINKNKSNARFAYLPLKNKSERELLVKLNSDNISDMKEIYSKLQFINAPEEFSFKWERPTNHELKIHMVAPEDGLLINFESWNKNWHLSSGEQLHRAFQMFRAINVKSGINEIHLHFEPRNFWFLFWLGILVPIAYALALISPIKIVQ